MLKAACEGRLFPKFALGHGVLPPGWQIRTLDELGRLGRGKSKHRPRDDERLYGGPYPFIQTGDVRKANGFVRYHSQTYSEFGLAQSQLWPAGTVCITIAANIAETAILAYSACFPDSIVGLICNQSIVANKWIIIFFEYAKERISSFAPATAQKNINLEILTKLRIPTPPLQEQHLIISEVDRRLSAIEALESQVQKDLLRSKKLRQSILKRAFEGKLVPQDPSDEPASILLDRIRNLAPPPKKTRV